MTVKYFTQIRKYSELLLSLLLCFFGNCIQELALLPFSIISRFQSGVATADFKPVVYDFNSRMY